MSPHTSQTLQAILKSITMEVRTIQELINIEPNNKELLIIYGDLLKIKKELGKKLNSSMLKGI